MVHPATGPTSNRLLAALSKNDFATLEPHFEDVMLMQHQVLFEQGRPIHRAYFPHDGFISLVSVFEDGPIIETATVGREGMAGSPLFVENKGSPTRAVVQVPGCCTIVPTRALQRAMADSAPLRGVIGNYIHAFLTQTMQTVACNATHSCEERLAKWLLMSADRVSGDRVPLTQEFLAQMLGVGRQTVSTVAGKLQSLGVIEYSRGKLAITNRRALERVSCDCYGVIRDAYEAVLPLTYR
ncbi:MAG: Crp/Fnr family transcriptional regulator [Gemmatimonas sp.]